MTNMTDVSRVVDAYATERVSAVQADLKATATELTLTQSSLDATRTELIQARADLVDALRRLDEALNPPVPDPEPEPLPDPEPVPDPEPEPATTFGDFLGLSNHTNFRKSIYAVAPDGSNNDGKTRDLVVSTGVKYVRDLLAYIGGFNQDALWRTYIAKGVTGFHATVGQYGQSNDKAKIIARLKESKDILVEVTGFNEPDTSSTTIGSWKAEVVAWQKWLYPTVKAINPNIAVGLGALRGENRNGAAELQELMAACAGFFDFVDVHCYPGPKSEAEIKKDLTDHVNWAKGAPYVVISEFGGSTANMDYATQSRVITTGIRHLATIPVVKRVFVYEVWQDVDPTGKVLQSNFGVFNSNGTPRPAATAMAALSKEPLPAR